MPTATTLILPRPTWGMPWDTPWDTTHSEKTQHVQTGETEAADLSILQQRPARSQSALLRGCPFLRLAPPSSSLGTQELDSTAHGAGEAARHRTRQLPAGVARTSAIQGHRERAGGGAGLDAALCNMKFRKVSDDCIELDAPSWKRPKHRADVEAMMQAYAYPQLGSRPVSGIARRDIMAVLSPIWFSKPNVADRLLARLARTFDYALAMGLRNDSPATPRIIRAGLPKRPKFQANGEKTAGHHEALPYHQVADALSKLDGTRAHRSSKAVLRFVALTAVRINEARIARWDEVDVPNRVWSVPAARTKAGREHRVPLSDQALALLSSGRRRTADWCSIATERRCPTEHREACGSRSAWAGQSTACGPASGTGRETARMLPARSWNCAWPIPWARRWSRRTPVPTCWRSVVKLCRDGPTIWTARQNRRLPNAASWSCPVRLRLGTAGSMRAWSRLSRPERNYRFGCAWMRACGRCFAGRSRKAGCRLRRLCGNRACPARGLGNFVAVPEATSACFVFPVRSRRTVGRNHPRAESFHQRENAPFALEQTVGSPPSAENPSNISGPDMASEPEPDLVPFNGNSVPVAHGSRHTHTIPVVHRTRDRFPVQPGHA